MLQCLLSFLSHTDIGRIGLDIHSQTLPINLLQPQSPSLYLSLSLAHTHILDLSQFLPSACVCMLAYCTRECVILMCECEWMGVEMSLLIFGQYRRSGCYMLSGPTFLWRKFRLKFVLKVQFGLKFLRALKAKWFVFFPLKFILKRIYVWFKQQGKKKDPLCTMKKFLLVWNCSL